MPGDPSLGTYAELGSSASASTASLSSRTSGVGANARNYSRTRNAMVAPLPVDIPSKRRETKPATLVANGSVWGKPVSMTVSDHVVSGGVGSIGVGSSSFDNDTDDNDSCTQSSAIWRPKAARNNAGTPDTSMSNGKPIIATTDNEYPTAAEASKVDTKLNTSTRSKPNNPTTVNKQTISAVTNVHGSFRSHPKDKLVLDEKWDEMSDNGMDFNEDVIEFADGKVRIGGMLSTARASANASPARSDTGGDGMDVRKRRILKSVSFHDNDTRLPSNDIESTKTTKSTGQHTFTTRALDDVGETRNTNAIKNNAYSDKPQVSWRKHDDNNSDNYNHITTTTTSNNNNSNSNYNSDQLFSPTAITPTTESNSIEQSSRGVHYREITANNINVNESEKLCKDTDSISTTKQADSTTNKEATISSISNTTTTATATTTATTTERPKLFQTDRTSSAIERARQRREEEERERVAREKRLAEKLRILEERAKQRDTSVSSEEKEVPESQESKASNNNKDTATSTGSSTRPTSNYNREQSSDSVATGGTHGHAPSRPASYGRRSNHFTMSTATATTSATTHDHTTSSSYRNDTSAIDRVMDAIKQQISSTEEIQERIRASIPGNSTLHLDDTPRSPVSLASVATTWRKATTATSSSTATTTATALTISSATSSSSTTSPIVSIETTMDNAKLASTHSSNIETSATHQQSSSTKTMKSQATPTHRSSPRLPALSSSKPVDANSTLNIDPIQQITLNKSTAQPYRPPALRRALEQQQQQQQQQKPSTEETNATSDAVTDSTSNSISLPISSSASSSSSASAILDTTDAVQQVTTSDESESLVNIAADDIYYETVDDVSESNNVDFAETTYDIDNAILDNYDDEQDQYEYDVSLAEQEDTSNVALDTTCYEENETSFDEEGSVEVYESTDANTLSTQQYDETPDIIESIDDKTSNLVDVDAVPTTDTEGSVSVRKSRRGRRGRKRGDKDKHATNELMNDSALCTADADINTSLSTAENVSYMMMTPLEMECNNINESAIEVTPVDASGYEHGEWLNEATTQDDMMNHTMMTMATPIKSTLGASVPIHHNESFHNTCNESIRTLTDIELSTDPSGGSTSLSELSSTSSPSYVSVQPIPPVHYHQVTSQVPTQAPSPHHTMMTPSYATAPPGAIYQQQPLYTYAPVPVSVPVPVTMHNIRPPNSGGNRTQFHAHNNNNNNNNSNNNGCGPRPMNQHYTLHSQHDPTMMQPAGMSPAQPQRPVALPSQFIYYPIPSTVMGSPRTMNGHPHGAEPPVATVTGYTTMPTNNAAHHPHNGAWAMTTPSGHTMIQTQIPGSSATTATATTFIPMNTGGNMSVPVSSATPPISNGSYMAMAPHHLAYSNNGNGTNATGSLPFVATSSHMPMTASHTHTHGHPHTHPTIMTTTNWVVQSSTSTTSNAIGTPGTGSTTTTAATASNTPNMNYGHLSTLNTHGNNNNNGSSTSSSTSSNNTSNNNTSNSNHPNIMMNGPNPHQLHHSHHLTHHHHHHPTHTHTHNHHNHHSNNGPIIMGSHLLHPHHMSPHLNPSSTTIMPGQAPLTNVYATAGAGSSLPTSITPTPFDPNAYAAAMAAAAHQQQHQQQQHQQHQHQPQVLLMDPRRNVYHMSTPTNNGSTLPVSQHNGHTNSNSNNASTNPINSTIIPTPIRRNHMNASHVLNNHHGRRGVWTSNKQS